MAWGFSSLSKKPLKAFRRDGKGAHKSLILFLLTYL
jgi:hypothetical protein